MQKEASPPVFTWLVLGIGSHSSGLLPVPSKSHSECHPPVLTHGIYRLNHDASLCVEHLLPSILTMILPGGTVIIPISKMEKLSPRDSGHMEVSSRAGIQYLACDSRVYPMQPPSLPHLLGGTLSPIKLANSF